METVQKLTDARLDALREEVAAYISGKRYRHTLGVEREIAELGRLYLPEKIPALRAAALLHDITKEKTHEEQLALCARYGIPVSDTDRISPKIFHAKTGCRVARDAYPDLVTDEIFDAIEKHTTGARDMSLFAKLLYLADYIEDTRTFPDCVTLRHVFWDGVAGLAAEALPEHLDRVILLSYDMTIRDLLENENPVALATIDARNALLEKFARE